MTLEEIGRSRRGIPIYMVTISSAGQPLVETGGVMIVARQHGNEPAGTRAMLRLINAYASDVDGTFNDLIGSPTIRIVPIANPDGANAFVRYTSNGRDMNRDWTRCSLPETRAIMHTVNQHKPEVLLDLHELTPGDHDNTYVLGIPSRCSSGLISYLKDTINILGVSASCRTHEHYHTSCLLHRRFASLYGRPALLVESKYRGDPAAHLQDRSDFHLLVVLATIEYINSRMIQPSGKEESQVNP